MHKATILVVDDEPILRELLEEEFIDLGYQVLTSSGGNEAFELVQSNPKIDIVLTDMRMPDGDGVELLKKVKNSNIDSPAIILLSGFSDISEPEVFAEGAEGVFSKPPNMEMLERAIEKLFLPRRERWTRQHEKYEIGLNLNLSFPDLEEAFEENLLNIGRGGMFIQMERDFPTKGDCIHFHFTFENEVDSPLKGDAIVRWVRETASQSLLPGIGVEFLNISDQSIQTLLSLVGDAKSKPFIPKR